MQNDLISRSAALAAIEWREKLLVGDKRISVNSFKNFIQNRPAVNAVVARHEGNTTFITTSNLDDYTDRIIVGQGNCCKVYYADADAVEVVRCGNCKHREVFLNDPAQMFCHKWLRTMPTDLNFFCAHGAKMDAEVEG